VISLVFQCVSASNRVDVSPKYLNPIKTGTDLIEKHRTEDSILAQSKVDSLKNAVVQGTNQATLQFTSNPPPDSWNYSSTSSGKAILTATVTASLSGSAGTPTGVVQFTVWFNGSNTKASPVSVNLKGGSASYTYGFGQGPNIVYVSYLGDSNYASLSSGGYPLFAQTYTFSQTYASGEYKCYEIPGMLYGIHMTNYAYYPGLCDQSKYPVTDCWYSWQLAPDNTWLYVYRHWNAGTSCPESQCCCSAAGVNVPTTQSGAPVYGQCGSSFANSYGGTCASNYPGYAGATYWVDTCSEYNTQFAPLDAWSSLVR